MDDLCKLPLRQPVLLLLVLACAGGCQHMPFGKNAASPATAQGNGSFFPWGNNRVASKSSQQEAKSERALSKVTPKQEADIQFAQARVLESEGNIEQASAMYTEVVKRDKHRGDAYHRLAILATKQGKFEESEKWFLKALKADPENPDISCDFGYSLYLQGRMDEAESRLHEALSADSDFGRAHNNLGLVYAHTDRLQAAIDEFTKGGATKANAYSNVAVALAMDGDLNEAKRIYQLAIEVDPECQAAQKGLKELKMVLARTDQGDASEASWEE